MWGLFLACQSLVFPMLRASTVGTFDAFRLAIH